MITTERHVWRTRSRHTTSEGIVSYQVCECGLWRVVMNPGGVLADRVGRGERLISTTQTGYSIQARCS